MRPIRFEQGKTSPRGSGPLLDMTNIIKRLFSQSLPVEQMTPNFQAAFSATMQAEGFMDLETVPGDAGGETFSGISRVNNPAWHGWVIIDANRNAPNFPACLKTMDDLRASVSSFFQETYWMPNRCGEMGDHLVAAEVFDQAVNSGSSFAAGNLQRALNVSWPQGQYFPPVQVDGQIGDQTIGALRAALNHESAQELSNCLNAFQAKHYIELAEAGAERFLRGWMRRVQIVKLS